MKIAVASDGTMVSEHFGHCEGFCLYEIQNSAVTNKIFLPNPGHKPGYLPAFLKEKNADVIIAGGMGETAQDLFRENEMDVIVGVQGNADEVVTFFLAGELKSSGSVCTKHAYEGKCNN